MVNESDIVEMSIFEAPNKLEYILDVLKPIYSDIVVAVVILLIGFIIGKIVSKLFHKVLNEIELNKLIKRTFGMRIRFEEFMSHVSAYFIYFITIILVMEILNLSSIIMYILSGGIIIVIIASVLLGIKDLIPNLFAGMAMHRKDFLKEGDYIKFDNIEGTVIDLNLIDVKIEKGNKDILFIPNNIFIKKEFSKVKRKTKKIE